MHRIPLGKICSCKRGHPRSSSLLSLCMYIHIQTHTELYTCLAPNTIYNYIIRPILRQRVIRNADRLTHMCKFLYQTVKLNYKMQLESYGN